MTGRVMDIGFIPERRIERAANQLLAEFGQRFSPVADPAVPVEGILESFLDWTLEFDDLVTLHNLPDALGAIYLRSRRVVIDMSLDPTEHPNMEGRYHFTLAHEIGHIRLHQPVLDVAGPNQTPQGEIILCRDTGRTKKPQMEWQADRFASYLLMPADMVRAAWVELTDDGAPICTADTYGAIHAAMLGQEMASIFHVSGDAMRIRLETMSLLVKTEAIQASPVLSV